MIQGFEDLCTRKVSLDPRVHSRIIGTRGKNVRKLMDDYKVEIQFPPSDAGDNRCVTVTGLLDDVEEAVDHLLNLEEEYLLDIAEVDQAPPPTPDTCSVEKPDHQGFTVRDAPWDQQQAPDLSSTEDFPVFRAVVGQTATSVWGQKRF
ncbi:vigilin-like [Scyliorhinus canicula]|uniref:vigilin-like n=1 Tax=Scyliorhinus canicula TaxID=7830 RepID=UPI0018F484A3|nr:vigilin-like [Scyliorhinus canicula]